MSSYDVILVLPYPFSDHPSFPEGILKKALEIEGFRVGIIETPCWQKSQSFSLLGRPSLFFGIIPGPVDSIVLNYTSSRKRRREDLYQISGQAYFEGTPPSISNKIRPDRTTIVFANRIREIFKDVPIIIGGLEASLRLFSHYDFQQDKIRRSVLVDSRADAAVIGIGEKQLVSIAHFLAKGGSLEKLNMPGIAMMASQLPAEKGFVELPSFESVQSDRSALIGMQLALERAISEGNGVAQKHGDRYVVAHRSEEYYPSDIDRIYGQTYTRNHLRGSSLTPALQMNIFSITSHRGCCGGCSFCSIAPHQGRKIVSRSQESIVDEVVQLTHHPLWQGYISDIGGASAEMYGVTCQRHSCKKPSCLYPVSCKFFSPAKSYIELLRTCRQVDGVKKIFLGSGIRHDVMVRYPEVLEEIMLHYAGKSLRIAPEHTEDAVLQLMRKPPFSILEEFVNLFRSINKRLKRRIELASYIIIGHPGESFRDVLEMKRKLRALSLRHNDVQIFTPSPGTLSTAMYYTGINASMRPIETEKKIKELCRRKDMINKI
ncbi:MAG: YgiQ family radical SAM protein [Thermodesulfobacteriota bacterium]